MVIAYIFKYACVFLGIMSRKGGTEHKSALIVLAVMLLGAIYFTNMCNKT